MDAGMRISTLARCPPRRDYTGLTGAALPESQHEPHGPEISPTKTEIHGAAL